MSDCDSTWDPKAPDELTDYSFDWSDALVDDDTIATFSSEVVDDESEIVIESEGVAGPLHTVWLSGGVLNKMASIKSKIVTAGGRREEKTENLAIRPR